MLVWMVPWAGLEGEGRQAVLTPASTPRFLYSDEVQIGPETVMTTLYTAKKYAVPALEAHCVEFLKKNLRADNAFMLLTQVQGWDAGGGAVGQGKDVGEGKAWDPPGHRCGVWTAILVGEDAAAGAGEVGLVHLSFRCLLNLVEG